jgi:glycosyltransferase involved in cell wall biosynthesis
VSVVIPARDAAETILEQLAAIDAQSYEGPVQIVVADNGSTDGTVDVVRAWAQGRADVTLVDASSRPGPSHARNQGVQASTGDVVLFCDADDRVQPGWLAAMVSALADADVVGAMRLDPARSRVEDRGPTRLPSFPFLPWAAGGELGAWRASFLQSGGFDEDLQIGEDVEFCWRIQVADHRFQLVPEARIWHRERASLPEAYLRGLRFGKGARRLYLQFEPAGARWPGWRQDVRALARLTKDAPAASTTAAARRRWLVRLGGHVGRVLGEIETAAPVWSRHRTLQRREETRP